MKYGVSFKYTDKQRLFRAFVEIQQPVLRIRPRTADVFAALLYLNEQKVDLPEEDRFDLIFSTKYRKQIAEDLNIKDSVLQNCLSELRKKNLIVNNKIPRNFQVFTEEGVLGFYFKLEMRNV